MRKALIAILNGVISGVLGVLMAGLAVPLGEALALTIGMVAAVATLALLFRYAPWSNRHR